MGKMWKDWNNVIFVRTFVRFVVHNTISWHHDIGMSRIPSISRYPRHNKDIVRKIGIICCLRDCSWSLRNRIVHILLPISLQRHDNWAPWAQRAACRMLFASDVEIILSKNEFGSFAIGWFSYWRQITFDRQPAEPMELTSLWVLTGFATRSQATSYLASGI